ncbi:hypothetical protein [Sediminibacterium sp. C3]|uniref:hypothetical protein n=1 Tax=Sediminibacterium sp. C3 TaxID=1267211 RepID=UPI0003F887EC|nr:hypothetical protein [Sediminibacterium sp. C3]
MSDKNILFIGPIFHDYHKKIIHQLEESGYIVTFVPDFSRDIVYFFLKSFFPLYLSKYCINKSKDLLGDIKVVEFDRVFVVKGEGFSNCFWKDLRTKYKLAKFYLYQWDSLANYRYENILQYFDHCYSFDSIDVIQLNQEKLKYLPLFYDDSLSSQHLDKSYDYDITFIGGVTLERYYWLTDFKYKCDKIGLNVHLFMYLPFFTYMSLVIRGKVINFNKIHFRPISLQQIKDIYSRTNTIIDIHSPKQSGLTMRTFEALGSGKKLMTTNFNITKEPFFNTDYIFTFKLLDDIKPKEIIDFVRSNRNRISLDQYKLSSWLNNIFNVPAES